MEHHKWNTINGTPKMGNQNGKPKIGSWPVWMCLLFRDPRNGKKNLLVPLSLKHRLPSREDLLSLPFFPRANRHPPVAAQKQSGRLMDTSKGSGLAASFVPWACSIIIWEARGLASSRDQVPWYRPSLALPCVPPLNIEHENAFSSVEIPKSITEVGINPE